MERPPEAIFSPEKELESIHLQMSEIESKETEAWGWVARLSGDVARSSRAVIWAEWQKKAQAKIQQIRKKLWRSSVSSPGPAAAAPVPAPWTH